MKERRGQGESVDAAATEGRFASRAPNHPNPSLPARKRYSLYHWRLYTLIRPPLRMLRLRLVPAFARSSPPRPLPRPRHLTPPPCRQISTSIPHRDWLAPTGPIKRSDSPFGHDEHMHHHRRPSMWVILPMIILPLVPIVCLGLGSWQLQRLQWKLNLIEDLQDKLQRAAIRLPRNVK